MFVGNEAQTNSNPQFHLLICLSKYLLHKISMQIMTRLTRIDWFKTVIKTRIVSENNSRRLYP